MIPFADWMPDQGDLESQGVTEAKNVIPAARGYRPLPSLSAYSGAAGAYIRGMFATKDNAGTVYLFAGDDTDLRLFSSGTGALDEISKSTGAYSVGSDDQWRFVQFGDDVLASHGTSDILQTYTPGTSSAFADLAGSPAAKYMAVVRDFVVCGFVTYGGTTYPMRMRWSSLNDHTAWTIGTTQADVQDIADAGDVTGIVGGETGLILCERALVRMTYVGSPLIFQFDKVETNRGCNYPGSVAHLGPNQVFFLADDGFHVWNGQATQPIGAERVNRYFFDDLNPAYSDRISAAVDPTNQIVLWGYTSQDSADGTPDKAIIYNYALNKWSRAEFAHDFIANMLSANYTLESLDNINGSLDALGTSLDSPLYAGGRFLFSASESSKIATFSGSPLAATLTTGEFEAAPMRASVINRVLPHISLATSGSAPTLTASVGSRSRQVDEVTYGAEASLTADNFCNVRAGGRFHRVKVDISGRWRFALGVDVEARATGLR